MDELSKRLVQASRVVQPDTRTLWQYTCEQLRVWLADEEDERNKPGEDPVIIRPYLMVLTEVYPRGSILRYRYARPASKQPPVDQVVDFILDQILKPTGEAIQARPNIVSAVDEAMVKELLQPMKSIGVEANRLSKADGVDDFVKKFSTRLIEKDQAAVSDSSNHPALLSIAGVTPSNVSLLFRACSRMVDRMPWKDLGESVIVSVQPKVGVNFDQTLYLTVLGSSGTGFGWAAMPSMRALKRKYRKAMNLFDLDKDLSHDMLCGSCGVEPMPGSQVLQCNACEHVFYCSDKCREYDWVLRHGDECEKIQIGELDLIIRKSWERREWTILATEQTAVPFDDLDSAAKHGWTFGTKRGMDYFIPFVSVTNPGFPPKLERPQPREIEWMTKICSALSQNFGRPTEPEAVIVTNDDLSMTCTHQCR